MPDDFKSIPPSLDSPSGFYPLVTPSDTTDLPDGDCRALLVEQAGAVTLTDLRGNVQTGVKVTAGYNPLRARRVHSTGLTCGAVRALY